MFLLRNKIYEALYSGRLYPLLYCAEMVDNQICLMKQNNRTMTILLRIFSRLCPPPLNLCHETFIFITHLCGVCSLGQGIYVISLVPSVQYLPNYPFTTNAERVQLASYMHLSLPSALSEQIGEIITARYAIFINLSPSTFLLP